MGKFKNLFVLCLAFIMISCANNMALTKGQNNVDLSKKSIALLYVKMSNQKSPGYQPTIRFATISRLLNRHMYAVKKNMFYKSEEDRFNEYLLSFELEPGTITIMNLSGSHNNNIFFGGVWALDLNLKADIKPNSVNYLGHIDAVIRDRIKDDEARAGSIFPLIDAAVVGFSTGTFDVVVEDRYDEDMKSFISEYPALQKVKVEKSILPQWIRPENRSAK